MTRRSGVRTEIDVAGIVGALSDALDLVGAGLAGHGKRVSSIAVRTAARLGWPDTDVEDAFLSAMIHDCGVSSSRMMMRLLGVGPEPPLEEDERDGHCERGEELLAGYEPFRRLARIVRHHHSSWSELLESDADPAEARIANLIHLADTADTLSLRSGGGRLSDSEIVSAGARPDRGGTAFEPRLLEAFRAACAPPAFWFGLAPRHLDHWIAETRASVAPRMQPLSSLRPLAELFAHIVDAKSHYTADHSVRVARLARHLGQLAGLPPEDLEDLEIAGLLHDLGKLGVPDEILERDGPLSAPERSIMERHPFETYAILHRIDVFRSIAGWAAWHHESLNGTGYPFGLGGAEIPFAARILSVADGLQALAADRPYRDAMPPSAALHLLRERVKAGELDGAIVHLVETSLDDCIRIARGEASA